MNSEIAMSVIQAGLDRGADFVDIFVEETRSSSVLFKDQKVESASAGTEYGVGVRLIYGKQVLYAHTSDDTQESLIRMVKNLSYAYSDVKKNPETGLFQLNTLGVSNIHRFIKDPGKVGQFSKLSFLKEADSIARKRSDLITQVSVSANDSTSQIQIFNSDGLHKEDFRARARFSINVTAGEGGERFSASESPGALGGFEFFEGLNIDTYANLATDRALLMLNAGYVDGGKMPVVMGNGFGGVIFHEACGHPLETEAIRHKASPFCDKIGEPIAHEAVTAIDDGTLGNAWGSLNIDDEGMETQKTVLIENGILKSYMSDKVGAEQLGLNRTGSARRESYKYSPVSRMRNTYIDAGKDTMDEMLASADGGIFAKKMGGGSVNPATGEFNFSVEEGYRIRNGKIAEPLRGATLIGKGHEVLKKISMVGNDLEFAAGMCGASSGSVPVTVGQPSLKVDQILVGGR